MRSSLLGTLQSFTLWLNRREFRTQAFTRLNERPVEYSFVLRHFAALQPRTVLDVGTGTTALPRLLRDCGALVTAIDNVSDYWPAGMVNTHYHVVDDDITRTRLSTSFDFITCVSALEHMDAHESAVHNMIRLLSPGGSLALTCPFSREYHPNVYELPSSEAAGRRTPFRTQSFSDRELARWLSAGARVLDQERWRFYRGEHWTEGERLPRPERAQPGEPHQIACLLLQRT